VSIKLGNRKKKHPATFKFSYEMPPLYLKVQIEQIYFSLNLQRSLKQKESQNTQHIMIHQTTKLTDQFLCSVLCQPFSMKIFYNSGNYLYIIQNTPAGPKQLLHWWITP